MNSPPTDLERMGQRKRHDMGRIPELWLAPATPGQPELPHLFHYQPALMFECQLQYRDVRAELIHSIEGIYTAWLPEGNEELAVDWSVPAVKSVSHDRLESAPRESIRPYQGHLRLTRRQMDQAQSDLIDYLVSRETLRLFYNPSLKRYSNLGEEREEFLQRILDEVRTQLQPQLKELARRLQLQVEQLREQPLPEDLPTEMAEELDSIRRQLISALENKMDALIMSGTDPTQPSLQIEHDIPIPHEIEGVQQELRQIEQEIFDDLHALLTEHLTRARECEEYEIRLQPTDIKILRRALLWIPVMTSAKAEPKPQPEGDGSDVERDLASC